ncbi:MAG TPA: hypothetical protein VHV81_06335 [Steroidobacteraceae bacterium]|nr:hypothetical protein [Steroidobacteraceae bacterium]
MIDAEVMRLRNLRSAALDARALAAMLDTQKGLRQTVFTRAAGCCWQIARIATGTLRAHPYPPYQRDAGGTQAAMTALSAELSGRIARQRGIGLQELARALDLVTRRLADARSLTWQQELSGTLGRLQSRLAMIVAEVASGARGAAETQGRAIPQFLRARESAGGANRERSIEANWPYLAF